MIFKRYGTTYHSVDPDFDSKTLNEIGFRRDQERAITAAEIEADYERVAGHELVMDAEGPVQDHTEQLLLDRLEAKLLELEAGLGEDEILIFENGEGTDYPKTRQEITNVIEAGESRLHFTYTVWPALRVGVYRGKR